MTRQGSRGSQNGKLEEGTARQIVGAPDSQPDSQQEGLPPKESRGNSDPSAATEPTPPASSSPRADQATPSSTSSTAATCEPAEDESGAAVSADLKPWQAQVDELTTRLTQALQAVAQLTEARRQLQQDFDRYRERTRAEQQTLRRKVAADLIQKFLVVVDDLERAVQAAASHDVERARQALTEGVQLVLGEAQHLLKEEGVVSVAAVGQPFDPRLHEALGFEPASGVPEGTVVQEIRRGYQLHDQLLRPALVVVARPGQAAGGTGTAGTAAPAATLDSASTTGEPNGLSGSGSDPQSGGSQTKG